MNWKQTVKFRDLLENFDDEKNELEEIERVKPLWIERFNDIQQLSFFVPKLKKVKTQSQFNKWLDEVYDYCDYNKIWVDF